MVLDLEVRKCKRSEISIVSMSLSDVFIALVHVCYLNSNVSPVKINVFFCMLIRDIISSLDLLFSTTNVPPWCLIIEILVESMFQVQRRITNNYVWVNSTCKSNCNLNNSHLDISGIAFFISY